jgi:hypothetical protein
MSRNLVRTVTLPVLVEVDHLKDADGRGNFLPGARAEESAVRIVRPSDIQKQLATIFTPKDALLYLAAIQLKQAFEAGDEFVLQQASEKMRPLMPDFVDLQDWESGTADGRIVFKISGMSRDSARLNYSRLLTDMFQGARLVMWFSEKEGRFLPALFCPDWKTAAFVVMLMGRIRVCPKCSAVFIPSADNVTYCTPAHREAHRVARSRWRAKRKC